MVGRTPIPDIFKDKLGTRMQRFLAYFIDMLIVGLPLMYMHLQRPELMDVVMQYSADPKDLALRTAYLEAMQPVSMRIFLSYLVYCFFLEGSDMQATLGKRLMGLKVVNATGEGLGIMESFFRNSTKIASYMVFSLGFIWILFDPARQGWHDKLARTYVIRRDAVSEELV
jgi:uncharacterized RDD family membrane protein YckC